VYFLTAQIENSVVIPRKNKKKRIAIIVALLFTFIVVIAGAFFLGLHSQDSPIVSQVVTHKKINILLLGINKRKDDPGRSNVTCVVTVDPDTEKVSMLWVPRDSRVNIPGYEPNKIGHAYAYGGPKLSEQTVSELLGIPIDYYVAINMDGFKKVIDALGGVDINVDKRMYYYDPYDEGEVDNDGLIDLQAGLQHMDGNTALQYVRFRHDEMGDIGRIERQQKFAKALLADIMSPSIITKLPSVIQEANSVFQTDMPVSQMLSLSKVITDAYKQGIQTDMVSGRPVFIDEISYWLPDVVAMRKQIAEIQGITINDEYLAAAQKLASDYEAALPKETTVAEASHSFATNKAIMPTTTKASTTSKIPTTTNKAKATTPNTNIQSDTASNGASSSSSTETSSEAVRKNTSNTASTATK
jgi:polyisoprenyl-teichoic acid--peptidoglycan teichoic acid transferase